MFALRLNFIDRFESWIETFLRKRFLCVAQRSINQSTKREFNFGKNHNQKIYDRTWKWWKMMWANFGEFSALADRRSPFQNRNNYSPNHHQREKPVSENALISCTISCCDHSLVKSSKKEQLFEENKLFYYAWAAAFVWFFGAKFIMPPRIPATKTHKEWHRPKMIQLFGHRSGKPFAKMHFVCLRSRNFNGFAQRSENIKIHQRFEKSSAEPLSLHLTTFSRRIICIFLLTMRIKYAPSHRAWVELWNVSESFLRKDSLFP